MSQVTLQGNASGTGIFTIAAPNSNTNRTLNLPDAGGAVIVGTQPAGDIVGTTATQTLTNKTLSTGTAITAGTINNTSIGATTTSTGAFTTLSATGVTTVQAGTVSAPAITTSGDTNTGIFFPAADTIGFTEGGVEAMRIDSAGNVGIGTSLPGAKLAVADGTVRLLTNNSRSTLYGINRGDTGSVNGMASIGMFGAGTNGYLGNITFSTGASDTFDSAVTERARIDSIGNLLVGTTGAIAGSNEFQVVNAAGDSTQIRVRHSSATSGRHWRYGADSSNTVYIINQDSNGVFMSNGNTSWSGLSDERHKDIIEPINNAAEKVSTLRAVIGKYKTDQEDMRRSFLIAQDVQAVLPEAVDVTDPEKLGLRYTEVIPLLTAAIQEQQVIIEHLKARLDAANL